MSERERIITSQDVECEYQARLEDDMLMRTITPEEEIIDSLKGLFGEELVEAWQKKKDQ